MRLRDIEQPDQDAAGETGPGQSAGPTLRDGYGMTCDEFRHDLHEHYAGRLDPEKVERLRLHGKTCPECDRLMVLAEEMTCREFTRLLNDYVDDVLPAGQRRAFDRHLSICRDCTAYLQSYRATMRLSAFAMRDAMRHLADEMPEGLIDAILAARAAQDDDDRG